MDTPSRDPRNPEQPTWPPTPSQVPSIDPYAQPVPQVAPTPGVWPWYIVYCVAMALLYLFCAGMGVLILLIPASEMDMHPTEQAIAGSVYLVIGLCLFIPYAVAPFLPKQKWVWVYGIVLIALGMTSCCTLPACIPLLIFWLKPETKLMFGWV